MTAASSSPEELARERVVVARVRRAHGLEGELVLQMETDHAEALFVPGRVVRVEDPVPGMPVELTIREVRPRARGWLVAMEEIPDRAMAERYGGRWITLARSELPETGPGEYFLHDLLDLEVEDEEGGVLGRVESVYDAPGGVLLGVPVGRKERLIPFRREVVREVDVGAGRVRVKVPEGLLDL